MALQKSIGIIISSTRQPRVGPQIAQLVQKTLAANTNTNVNLKLIDIRDFNLPLFDEPLIPAKITSPEGYTQEHTRKWSQEISSHDAFVFVTAQYNWSIPASLKNALDFLFNEWKSKPALIVSYGGRGGGKGAAALLEVCKGLGMKPHPDMIELPLAARDGFMAQAQQGVLMDYAEEVWTDQLDNLKVSWASFSQVILDETHCSGQAT